MTMWEEWCFEQKKRKTVKKEIARVRTQGPWKKTSMEEELNKEVKEGWRFAASAARITEETEGEEDCKHTSGGVLVAIDSNLSRFQEMKVESHKHG